MFSTPTPDAFTKSLCDGNATTIVRNSRNSIDAWIGSRLRTRRTSRGITQQELSRQLSVDCNDVNAYEAGTKRVSAKLILCIAHLLEVRPRYFFQGYTDAELARCLEDSPLPSLNCGTSPPSLFS
jgi:ribosome-binding protein aMBF1 (putative translation factor)